MQLIVEYTLYYFKSIAGSGTGMYSCRHQHLQVYIQRCHRALSMGIPEYALPIVVHEIRRKDSPHVSNVMDSSTLDVQLIKDADLQLVNIMESFQSAQL